ncbi:unnamed protein product [Polarella glacialis]|uniref:PBP domain-containing protein n=1 Tax=Polarella glacialis TaxID=89957 RepID=A0A813IG73_POLGL|nr:unnamed protein product [Polarella glacialis]CAE8650344.1 unnamed protein product [Polarella glacialis]
MAKIRRACLAVAMLSSFGEAAGEVNLHGSGTTNPSKFFWNIMETFKARTKVELLMTYRAVGSGTGQKEFVGESPGYTSLTDFGSGDIPMTQARFNTLTTAGRAMVHVPFSLGAIGVFHSIPVAEVGTGGLKLSACLLAKVYSNVVTTWDDPLVLAENPNLSVPAGTKIQVGHRTLGSSSTGGLAGYLNQECPASWSLGSSGSTVFPTAATFTKVEGSPGMQTHIANNKYAIGYLDAGHGHLRKFEEVSLMNKDNTWLTSKNAIAASDANGNNGVAAAGAAAVTAGSIPVNADADWSAVSLFNKAGANTWPIVLISYMYLNKDISAMSADMAGILKAFVDFVTGVKGQAMLPTYDFNAIPSAMNKWSTDVWPSMTKPASVTTFTFEDSTAPWTGAGDYVISSKRDSYSMWAISELQTTVKALETKLVSLESSLNDYGIVALHGSGTTNPRTWFAKAMKLMEGRARAPLLLTYRAVGSGTGQKEFVGQASNGYKSYNHFGCGDIPMSQANFDLLPAGQEMVHIPFGLGAIGVFFNIQGVAMSMDACLLAKIFMGTITTWDHADIKAQNPSVSLPAGTKIQVGHRTLGSSSTGGLSGYLNKKCPSVWTLGESGSITWPTTSASAFTAVLGSPGMQSFIKTTPYSIGYLDAGQGHDLDLPEVRLANAAGVYMTSKESIAKNGVAAAGNAAVAAGAFPTDHSITWAAVNAYDMAGSDTWPIVLVSYFYVKKDQTVTVSKTAAALKAFVTMIVNNDDGICEEAGFTGLSSDMKAKSLAALGTVVFPSGMTEFVFETSAQVSVYDGMATNVISAKRVDYDLYAGTLLENKVTTLAGTVSGLSISGVIPLHGSGTTNPKTWFAEAMKSMEDRSMLPLFLSYRAVGSGWGMKDFVGASNGYKSYNSFGSGDIPMSSALYASLPATEKMVHIPFALGAIGVFHSVAGQTLQMSACLLAKIFMAVVTTWDNADILAENPNLKVPAGQKIVVGHRTYGSSSTGGLTGYLNKVCPAVWSKGESGEIAWPAGTTAVEGSPGMQKLIASTPYSIGYLDAGHGHSQNFAEVKLTNKAGTTQSSKDSIALDGVGAAGSEGLANNVFPTTADSDWSAVNIYNMAGTNTWPIVLVSYFYVKKDQSATNAGTASALKGFITMILRNEDNLCQKNAFTPPSASLKTQSLSTLSSITWPDGLTEMRFETDILADGTGMKADVVSAKRYAYDDYERSLMATSIATIDGKLISLGHTHEDEMVSGSTSSSSNNAETLAIASIVIAVFAIFVSMGATCKAMQVSKRGSGGSNGASYAVDQQVLGGKGNAGKKGQNEWTPAPKTPDKGGKGGKGKLKGNPNQSCWVWNRDANGCQEPCSAGRAHTCEFCQATDHRGIACPTGGGKGGKGN